jgi:hypothetical protein
MTNEDTINNSAPISKEEIAIINAAFKLHKIVIRHRIYRRTGGKSQFTWATLVQARKALASLKPSVPDTNPVQVAAILAKNEDLARASVKLVLAEAKQALRETWDSIRRTALGEAEVQNLSEESPIWKLLQRATNRKRIIRELGHDYVVSRVAHLASALADKVSREATVSTETEAA